MMPIFTMVTWGGGGGRSCSKRSTTRASLLLLVCSLLLSYHSTPANAVIVNSGTSLTGLTAGIGGLPNFSGFGNLFGNTAPGTSSTTITAGSPVGTSDLFSTIALLFRGGTITTDITSGSIGGVAGSLALLAAALKAPLVALYQISAEVVVMVALILFISYIASLLGIDDFRRRSGVVVDPYETDPSRSDRGFFSNIVNSEVAQDLTNRVYTAIEKFDLQDFLERLDTRY